jgi:hypothetical protein
LGFKPDGLAFAFDGGLLVLDADVKGVEGRGEAIEPAKEFGFIMGVDDEDDDGDDDKAFGEDEELSLLEKFTGTAI